MVESNLVDVAWFVGRFVVVERYTTMFDPGSFALVVVEAFGERSGRIVDVEPSGRIVDVEPSGQIEDVERTRRPMVDRVVVGVGRTKRP